MGGFWFRARWTLVVLTAVGGCADRPLYLPENAGDLSSPRDLGMGGDLAAPDLAAPDLSIPSLRQLAPLSTSSVTLHRPTLRWQGGGAAAQVELCRDRACTQSLGTATTDPAGGRARPDSPLPVGPVFWRVRDGSAITPVWEFWVGAIDATVDTSRGTTLDVNGDGFADVAVAVQNAEQGIDSGYVYLGGAGGPVPTPAATLVDPSLSAPDWIGIDKMASAGDLDGDGFGDLVFSSLQADMPGGPSNLAGVVRVVYGSAAGLDLARTVTLRGPADTSSFGVSIAGIGDFNGDGYGDLLVASGGFTPPSYVFWGGPDGISDADATRFQRIENSSFNAGRNTVAGDFNGDGYGDFVLSADNDNVGNAISVGRAWLFYGGPNGAGAPVELDPPPQVGQYSFFLAALDYDGDGYSDLVSAGTIAGTDRRVFIYRGGPNGLGPVPDQALSRPDDLQAFYGAGDLDGDGRDDLLFGDLIFSDPTRPHHAVVYFSGSATTASLSGPGELGLSMSGANDVNGDGHEDAIIGAPDSPLGRAFIYFGRAGGISLPDMGPLEIDSPPVDGGSAFGAWVAGRS